MRVMAALHEGWAGVPRVGWSEPMPMRWASLSTLAAEEGKQRGSSCGAGTAGTTSEGHFSNVDK